MENNFKKLLSDKAFRFGVDTYRICNSIMKTKNEWILTRQLMRSSTSVGAIIAESEHAQSSLDFINKRAVSRKECNESFYWIAMMQELELIAIPEAEKLGRQAQELMRLLTSAIKTSKRNLEQSQKKKKEE